MGLSLERGKETDGGGGRKRQQDEGRKRQPARGGVMLNANIYISRRLPMVGRTVKVWVMRGRGRKETGERRLLLVPPLPSPPLPSSAKLLVGERIGVVDGAYVRERERPNRPYSPYYVVCSGKEI